MSFTYLTDCAVIYVIFYIKKLVCTTAFENLMKVMKSLTEKCALFPEYKVLY